MHGSKITIRQLIYLGLKKKERNSLCKCPVKADTRTVSPTVVASTIRGGEKIQSDLTQAVLGVGRIASPTGVEELFFFLRRPPLGNKSYISVTCRE